MRLLQYVETEWWRNKNAVGISGALIGCELVMRRGLFRLRLPGSQQPVLSTNSSTSSGLCIALMTRLNDYLILDTSQSYQALPLQLRHEHVHTQQPALVTAMLSSKDLGRSVDHNGSESAIDTGLAEFKAVAVIQMQSDRNIRILDNCCLNQLYQISMVGISSCALWKPAE